MATNNRLTFIGGALIGAAGMYLYDPHRGAYRRAFLRDKSVHYRKTLGRKIGVVGRDVIHRSQGMLAEARTRILPQRVPDDILVARVASKLGRVVSNPHAVELSADSGRVILSGPVFIDEAEKLIHTILRIPGVRGIQNRLETHSRSEKFPGLQGHRHLKGQQIDIFQKSWAPATRFLVAVGGGLAALGTSALVTRRKGA
jgi:hypothetical protein